MSVRGIAHSIEHLANRKRACNGFLEGGSQLGSGLATR